MSHRLGHLAFSVTTRKQFHCNIAIQLTTLYHPVLVHSAYIPLIIQIRLCMLHNHLCMPIRPPHFPLHALAVRFKSLLLASHHTTDAEKSDQKRALMG